MFTLNSGGDKVINIIKKSIFLSVVFLISFKAVALSSQADYYEEGVKAKESGAWVKALNIWEAGRRHLEEGGMSDLRIGIAYIETVTEQQKEFYYVNASDMYIWGLRGSNIEEHQDEIVEEADRIIPLLVDEDKKIWKDLRKKHIKTLRNKILDFWDGKDPIPGTKENERLIEHWERIAYSRKNFRRNKNSPYKTDDRGTIYIKYGKPDNIKQGNLGEDMGELHFWASEIDNSLKDAGYQIERNIDPVETIKSRVSSSYFGTEYESWKYVKTASEEPLVFLFGSPEGRGYHLVNSAEEFIASRAWGKSSSLVFTYAGPKEKGKIEVSISPGSILQLMLYKKIMLVDHSFARRFDDLENEWMRSLTSGTPNVPHPSVIRGYKDRYTNADTYDPKKLYGIQEVSDLRETIKPITINTSQFRLLDKDNTPRMSVLAVSYPSVSSAADMREILAGNLPEQDFRLKNTLIIKDADWKELDRKVHIPKDKYDNFSLFTLDHSDSTRNYTITSETIDTYGKGQFDEFSLHDLNKLGEEVNFGKAELSRIPPLSADYSSLEVSDIITGIQLPEEYRKSDFPFPLLPVERISKTDLLYVYVEAYHLSLDPQGKVRFSIRYSIAPAEEEGFFERVILRRNMQDEISQESIIESDSSTSKQTIMFDIQNLAVGDYKFIIEVKDLISGQTKHRTGRFKIGE